MDINKMNELELREYLNKIPSDKVPSGNSKFKCKKHNRILPYTDIVWGCFFCVMDDANEVLYKEERALAKLERKE